LHLRSPDGPSLLRRCDRRTPRCAARLQHSGSLRLDVFPHDGRSGAAKCDDVNDSCVAVGFTPASSLPEQTPMSSSIRMKTLKCICFAIICSACPGFAIAQADRFDTNAIQEFLYRNFDGKNSGMVIGVVDEHGSQVFAAGKMDNSTDDEVNGDTLFEIGSI